MDEDVGCGEGDESTHEPGGPRGTVLFSLNAAREHSYLARRIVYISLHDERSPVSRCRCVSRGEILPWLKFWKAVASSLKSPL
jgi:hypothetical protein